jgi:hypothetical protein
MTMKLFLFLFPFVLSVANAPAQSFESAARDLTKLMNDAAAESDYERKHAYMKTFSNVLNKTLKMPGSLYRTFDSIPHLKVLASKDGVVRIFNWGIPDEKGDYAYYAIVQRRMGGEGSPLSDIYVMEDIRKNIVNPEEQILHYPEWFGCLYYDIVEKQDGGRTVYTLLGFDFHNRVSYKKYIDILIFNAQGIPSFGSPIFVEDKGAPRSRVVFEYWSQSVLHLSYRLDLDKIVFNWLYPIVPEKKHDKAFYVSDVTYDGFEFKSGKWRMLKHVLLKKEF